MEKFVLIPQDKYQRLLGQSKQAQKEHDNTKTPRIGDREIKKRPIQPPPGKRDKDTPPSKKTKVQTVDWISF